MLPVRVRVNHNDIKYISYYLPPFSGRGVVKVGVMEGDSVVLPCSPTTKENLELELYDWKKDQLEVFMYDAGSHYNNDRSEDQDEQFRGRVSHFQDQLQFGNASIIINNTKISDTGTYTCAFPRLQPVPETYYIELTVGE